ncbi:2Fe-2S iron-sulfur cluster-binding protein [Haloglomus halophilum]|uniref:2Fe-2S iron-sulfur cluster-binding protein n=1 Tax=Haloglomus halophilum TaxID=2962672 RepID=UPI0020C95C98|nr:2Fe-2S iron-sulfur cluster-binding protein [Haloglomus halophilum]
MVEALAVALGATLTLLVVGIHFSKGTEKAIPDDIAQEVTERRAAQVPETDFAEPMNRSIGGGGAVAAVGGAEGEAAGELGDEEEEVDPSDDPSVIPDDEADVFEVEYVKEGETVEVKENETLLEAGEDEGWDLPYACREGQCVSCAGHITDGATDDFIIHSNNEMLGQEELDDGYTLTCVAYPTDDLSLETGETP